MCPIAMKKSRFLAMVLVATSGQVLAGPSFEERAIADVGWKIISCSQTYDALADATTFAYVLTVSQTEKDLSHWTLNDVTSDSNEAPQALFGNSYTSYGPDPTTGVFGWKWDDSQAKGSTVSYRLTVQGHVSTASVDYAVKGGTYFAVGETCGPGSPIVNTATYTISGIVFLDINQDGNPGADEPRLDGVSVLLSNGTTALTGSDGSYSFSQLESGTYTVQIPDDTASNGEDFNEHLRQYFLFSGGMPLHAVQVGPDSIGNNFGYIANIAAVMDDLNPADPDFDGISILGEGRTIGFWKHNITFAKQRKTKGAQLPATAINDLLFGGTDSIKNLSLAAFSDIPVTVPSAYDYVLNILGAISSDPIILLQKQLVATELNHLSGFGIEHRLQKALIGLGENYVMHGGQYPRDQVLNLKDLFDTINNLGH